MTSIGASRERRFIRNACLLDSRLVDQALADEAATSLATSSAT
jgi:hypothetical protein